MSECRIVIMLVPCARCHPEWTLVFIQFTCSYKNAIEQVCPGNPETHRTSQLIALILTKQWPLNSYLCRCPHLLTRPSLPTLGVK